MTIKLKNPKWVTIPFSRSDAKVRLFCFPYGGSGSTAFYPWHKELPSTVELCLINLPGRESRIREQLATELAPLIDSLASAIIQELDRPFAFFGHSMGALMVYELSRVLRERKKTVPIHLFVSGHRAPHINCSRPHIRHMNDFDFIAHIKQYNGIPELVLNTRELMDIYLPILRADFSIIETYQYDSGSAFDFPITAFGGSADPRATPQEIEGWKEHTNRCFQAQFFNGGHFFINQHRKSILDIISKSLVGESAVQTKKG